MEVLRVGLRGNFGQLYIAKECCGQLKVKALMEHDAFATSHVHSRITKLSCVRLHSWVTRRAMRLVPALREPRAGRRGCSYIHRA